MPRETNILFSPIKVGKVIIPNRFMRSPTMEGMADSNGIPTKEMNKTLVDYANGNVGLIIPGAVSISSSHRFLKTQAGLWSESQASQWKGIVENVQQKKSKIIFQLTYGRVDSSISEKEIKTLIESHVSASKLASKIGANGIQLHGAHGTVLSNFISPTRNKRDDSWGKDRTSIIKAIAAEIKSAVPDDFIISIKIDGEEYPDEATRETSAEFVYSTQKYFDFFEISSFGASFSNIRSNFSQRLIEKNFPPEKAKELFIATKNGLKFTHCFHLPIAKTIRERNPKVKLGLVGGCRKFNELEKIVKDGIVDLISFSRPLIREPDLIKKFLTGKSSEAECVNCGMCILRLDYPIRCYAK